MNILRLRYPSAKVCFFLILSCLLTAGAKAVPVHEAAFPYPGFHVSDRYLLDANGNNFIMRGINHPYTWFPTQTSSFANIKSTRANTVRVVLSSGHRWSHLKTSLSNVAKAVSLCKTNKLVCVLEVHDTTGYKDSDPGSSDAVSLAEAVKYWKEIKSVLIGQEAYVIINIGNEAYGNNNTSDWVNAAENAIAEMRNAGFHHTLMVDAPNWGQDTDAMMKTNAVNVFNSDVDRNTVFSIHMFGAFDTPGKVENYILSFVNNNIPLVIGEFGYQHPNGNPDEDAIMKMSEKYGIGTLGWSWSGNSGGVEYLDMVTSFTPSLLTSWGDRIVYGQDGIRATSCEASIYSSIPSPVICAITPLDPNPASAASLDFLVKISEAVTGVDATDFLLTTTGITGASISALAGSENTYIVTVNTGAGNGTIRLDAVDDDTLLDGMGNPLGGTGQGNGSFDTGDLYSMVILPKPALLSPPRGQVTSNASPIFTWNPFSDAVQYEVQLASEAGFDTAASHFVTDPMLTLSLPDGKYYWRVRGYARGEPGYWSIFRDVTIDTAAPGEPTLLLPGDTVTVRGRPMFRWNVVSGAAMYQFEIDNNPDFSSPLFSINQRAASRKLPGNPRGTYSWHVRAQDAAGTWGDWSQVFTVTILPAR